MKYAKNTIIIPNLLTIGLILVLANDLEAISHEMHNEIKGFYI